MNQISNILFFSIVLFFGSALVFGHQSDTLLPLTKSSYFKAHAIKSMKVVLHTYSTAIIHETWTFDRKGRVIYQSPYKHVDASETEYDKWDRKKSIKLSTSIEDSLIWTSTEFYTYKGKSETVRKMITVYPDGNKKVLKPGIIENTMKLTRINGDTTVIYDYFLIHKKDKKLPKYKYYQLNDTTTITNEYHYDQKGIANSIETTYIIFYSNGQLAERGTYEYDEDEIIDYLKQNKPLMMRMYHNDDIYENFPYPGLKKSRAVNYHFEYTKFGRLSEYKSIYDHIFYTYNSTNQIVNKEYNDFGKNYKVTYEYSDSGLLLGYKTYKEEELIDTIEYQYEFYEKE